MVDVLARVEIDVFSGVSNPCQSVSLELLLERFKCLSSIEEPAPQASTLGYRGIIICFPLEFGGRTRVFRGYVSNATGCWLDNDRLFETWILEIVSDALGDASLPEQGMSAIPRQLAAGLTPSMLRLSTAVDSLVSSQCVRLGTGESIDCRAIVLAVEGKEAARLTNGMIPLPEFNSTTCFYFAASHPPFNEPLLLLNGDNDGPINNLSVVSNVAKNYAPAGQALISASVTGKLAMKSGDLSTSVLQQLRRWFGSQVDSWSMLRKYEIPMALPSQRAGFSDGASRTPLSSAGVYHCGDYCETSSIQGAMLSGRKTAEALIADLSKSA